jgi:hypothetical protein
MKSLKMKGARYLILIVMGSANLFLFQNCSDYAGQVSMSAPQELRANKDLQAILDNSPSLIDAVSDPNPADSVSVVVQVTDPVNHTDTTTVINNDGTTTGTQASPTPSPSPEVIVDNGGNEPEASPSPSPSPEVAVITQTSTPKPENKELAACEKFAAAAKIAGMTRVDIHDDSEGKDIEISSINDNSEGKDIEVSSGRILVISTSQRQINLRSLKVGGAVVVCGNIYSSDMVSAHGNLTLIGAHAKHLSMNGILRTAHISDDGIEKVWQTQSGNSVQDCSVDSEMNITINPTINKANEDANGNGNGNGNSNGNGNGNGN